jgi:hypothetical protein
LAGFFHIPGTEGAWREDHSHTAGIGRLQFAVGEREIVSKGQIVATEVSEKEVPVSNTAFSIQKRRKMA